MCLKVHHEFEVSISVQLTMLLTYCSQYYEIHLLPFNLEQGMFLCLSTDFFLGKSFFVHSSLWSLAPVQLMGFFLYLFPPWPSVERVLGNTPCCRLYSFLLRAFSAHILFIRGRCPSRVTGTLYTAS